MDDELLDLVDKNDVVIGTINRKDYKNLVEQDLGYIRSSELFIMNDEGKLWTPTRTTSKTIAPNGYDYSAAGHVGAGNDYLETIIRETKEEINLKVSEDDLIYVAKMRSDNERYFRSIYLLHSNDEPVFNPADFVTAEWLLPDEIIKEIDDGHLAKSTLRETIIQLKAYLQS